MLRVEALHRKNVVFESVLSTSTSQKVEMVEFIFHVISKIGQ